MSEAEAWLPSIFPRQVPMPKFHFDLRDRLTIWDAQGEEFASANDAIQHAIQVAMEFGRNRTETSGEIVVREGGQEIYRVPLDRA
jgi:hypothetical protein